MGRMVWSIASHLGLWVALASLLWATAAHRQAEKDQARTEHQAVASAVTTGAAALGKDQGANTVHLDLTTHQIDTRTETDVQRVATAENDGEAFRDFLAGLHDDDGRLCEQSSGCPAVDPVPGGSQAAGAPAGPG